MNCGRPKLRPTVSREAGWLSSSIMAAYLWFGCDSNLDVSALLELHIIAMFVS
jgi:hypothetical protein